jgi:hypothetical protein
MVVVEVGSLSEHCMSMLGKPATNSWHKFHTVACECSSGLTALTLSCQSGMLYCACPTWRPFSSFGVAGCMAVDLIVVV